MRILTASLLAILAASPYERGLVREHLPDRAKPPLAGDLPRGVAPFADRLGVPPRSDADRAFDRAADDAFLGLLLAEPVHASALGLRQYDALFPPTDSAAVDSVHAWLAHAAGAMAEFQGLSPERAGARERIVRGLRACAADDRWRRDPGWYVANAFEGAHTIIEDPHWVLPTGTSSLIARLDAMGGLLRDGRTNVRKPADVAHATGATRTLVHFLSDQLPVAFQAVHDPVLREEFDHHLAQAAGAAADFFSWLRTQAPSGESTADTIGDPEGATLEALLEPAETVR